MPNVHAVLLLLRNELICHHMSTACGSTSVWSSGRCLIRMIPLLQISASMSRIIPFQFPAYIPPGRLQTAYINQHIQTAFITVGFDISSDNFIRCRYVWEPISNHPPMQPTMHAHKPRAHVIKACCRSSRRAFVRYEGPLPYNSLIEFAWLISQTLFRLSRSRTCHGSVFDMVMSFDHGYLTQWFVEMA